MAVGSAISLVTASMAARGLVTGGGPSDPRERQTWLVNHQPYSIRLGDKWLSYNRLGPFGMLLGTTADFVDVSNRLTEADNDKIGTMLIAAAANALINKTWLSGPSAIIQALSDPERYGERWLSNNAASLVVPGAVSQAAQEVDPVLRDTHGVLEAIKARIPGMSQELPAKRDIFGQPIVREAPLSPMAEKTIPEGGRGDAAANEMERLGIFPTAPSWKIGENKLTPKGYEWLSSAVGQRARADAGRLIASPEYRQASEEDQRDALEKGV